MTPGQLFTGCILRAAILCAVGTAVVGIAEGEQHPQRTLDVELDFTPNTSASHWIHGFLPKYTRGLDGRPPTVWMIDSQGRTVVPKTELTFPGVRYVEVKALSADTGGNMYASFQAWSDEKAATGAICKFPAGGGASRLIRTNDFLAVAMAVTPRGDIWAFGLPVLLITKRETTMEYSSLLHFSPLGILVESLLPRSSFGEKTIPTLAFGDTGEPIMWSSRNRVGLYTPAVQRWIEFDPTTSRKVLDLVASAPVAASGKPAAIFQMAMTDSDDSVFAAFYDPRPGSSKNISGTYWLDKESRRWIVARPDGMSAEYQLFSGGDGDSLVFRAGSKTFGWFSSQPMKPSVK